ncbi:HlyD family secretion protein [Burkholderia dolosa]|uniref:HlyD family secretion protein n=1 Tax=Burkholderia dolosa TaxID=152500 RepID=UPI001592706C|nr:HlyD family efflux transporter periplasmic adaptor subunit [Burkholderia dolosa]MBY4752953.1 HlyD family secretion protein [Burkholderia dolosa]
MAIDVDSDVSSPRADVSTLPLFRETALEFRQRTLPGTVLLSQEVPRWVLTIASLAFALAVCAFLAFGNYTRRVRVGGQVQLTQKVAHVYASVDGTVVKRLVNEGQLVEIGTPLYVIDSDRRSASIGQTQEAITASLNERRDEISSEKIRRSRILVEERQALDDKVRDLEAELRQMRAQASALHELVGANEQNLNRYRQLAAQGYFPLAQLQQKVQDNLDVKAKLAGVERDMAATLSGLQQSQSAQRNFPLQAQNELSGYDQKLADLSAQLADNEGRREIVVYSQIHGRVTAALYDPGQSVASATLLVSVVPYDAQCVVDLYAPSRAAGLISIGSAVLLRYEAFPYEKFGQYGGHVIEIAHTALPPTLLQQDSNSRETLYRVRVQLDGQTVKAYGRSVNLEDGMKVDADILLETRKIYEWVLEPLYAISGRYGGVVR